MKIKFKGNNKIKLKKSKREKFKGKKEKFKGEKKNKRKAFEKRGGGPAVSRGPSGAATARYKVGLGDSSRFFLSLSGAKNH